MAEVISVDNSIVMVLKPNELAKKKDKFKQVCVCVCDNNPVCACVFGFVFDDACG